MSSDRSAACPEATRWLLVDDRSGATAVSVGVEPGGVPDGVVWLGGGPDAFAAVLEDQIARRRRGELPIVVEDPQWTLAIDGADPLLERVHESLLTLADGRLGTRGSVLAAHDAATQRADVRRVHQRGRRDAPAGRAALEHDRARGRAVQVRCAACLTSTPGCCASRSAREDGRLDALLFSSLARPGTPVLRARDSDPEHAPRPRRSSRPPESRTRKARTTAASWMRVKGGRGRSPPPRTITCAAPPRTGCSTASPRTRASSHGAADQHAALDRVRRARRLGFDGLLCEHRRAWASRWEDADVVIEGDPELQLAVRFALFHLIASVAGRGRGGGRGARAERQRVPRACVLGQRRVRPAVPRRDPPRRGAGDARVPRSGGCPRRCGRRAPRDATAPGSRGSPPGPGRT